MSLEITTSSPQVLSAIRLSLGNSFNSVPSTSSIQPFIGNNSASGNFSSILGGQNNNTNGQPNTFILGSNIVATTPNTTYVENLSSRGILQDQTGSSLNWNNVYTSVNVASANWNTVYNNVGALSGNWNSVYNNVSALSSNWNSVYNNVGSLSSNWTNVYTSVTPFSGNWNNSSLVVQLLSSSWFNTFTTVKQSSANWSNSYTSVHSTSGIWNNIATTVSQNSAFWGTGGTLISLGDVPLLSSEWNSTYTTVNQNSASWGIGGGGGTTISSVLTSEWDSTYNTVLNLSSNWNSAASWVNNNSQNATFNSVSASSLSGVFYGDGSKLTGIVAGTTISPILTSEWNSSYTFVQNNSANATFTSSVSAPALSGVFYGDGSNLIGASLPGQTNINTVVISQSANWNTGYSNAIYTVNGTPNQISVTPGGSNNADNSVTISLPNDINIPGTLNVPGTLNITGTLNVPGSAYFYNTTSLQVSSNIIYFGEGNSGNSLDLGIVSHFVGGLNNGSNSYQHTGLARKAGQGSPGIWTLFSGLLSEPGSTPSGISWSDATLQVDTLSANILGNLSGDYVTAGNGNSVQWNSTYNNVNQLSSNWQSTYTNFNAQSPNNSSVYNNVNSLSGNWNSAYTSSPNWNSVYSNVNSLSGNWQSTYTNFNAQSPNNSSVYSNVNSLSGNWSNSYTYVNQNSATLVSTSNGTVTNIIQLTQAQYNALGSYSATTMYVIVG